MCQSAIPRLNKDKESGQKQIAAEQEKVGKLRRDAAKLREEAVKTKSATTQSSKRRQAESKERDLATAEKRLAQLLGKKSKVEADLVRNLNSLQRVEDQARRQQETKGKRRRQEELRHVQGVTREVERQSRLQASVPRWQLTIELVQRLPEEITVLFLAANPRDTSWIGLDEEIRLVEQKLRASEHRDAVTLKAAWAVRPDRQRGYWKRRAAMSKVKLAPPSACRVRSEPLAAATRRAPLLEGVLTSCWPRVG
jgi:hypothetical protein